MMEHDKSFVCCKVEQTFHIVKNQMGYVKVVFLKSLTQYNNLINKVN